MLVVQKFGGTSVADVERIRTVAGRIARMRAAGHEVVVVVSAMAGETNRLLALAKATAGTPDERESDALVATGEQVTAALTALALHDAGVPARSFLGHQVRIETDSAHGRARIVRVDVERLRAALAGGVVAVVAGFQGVDEQGSITTLGRGGSDTSAVALAAALDAEVCEIYTDVQGVYTSDPRIVPQARKLERITYDEMLELASLGAKVLQIRSQGIAGQLDVAKVSIVGVGMRTHAGIAARMFEVLSNEGINIQMISTSEIKISVVIDAKYTELAVRALHDAFIPPTPNPPTPPPPP